MKLEMEREDIQSIAKQVADILGPLLTGHSSKSDDTIFDVPALAAYLNVSTKWIYERTHLKEIPYKKAGGQLRFRKKEIDTWFDSYSIPAVNKTTSLKALTETS